MTTYMVMDNMTVEDESEGVRQGLDFKRWVVLSSF